MIAVLVGSFFLLVLFLEVDEGDVNLSNSLSLFGDTNKFFIFIFLFENVR